MSVVSETGWQGQFTSSIDTSAAPGADCVGGRQEGVHRCRVVLEGLVRATGRPWVGPWGQHGKQQHVAPLCTSLISVAFKLVRSNEAF